MRHTVTDLASWPLTQTKRPILNSTKEAFLYAQLIYNDPLKQAHLVQYREEAYKALKSERESIKPNPQRMMDLAVRAQLYREAYMEASRINYEKSNPSSG